MTKQRPVIMLPTSHLLHDNQLLRHRKARIGLSPHLLDIHPRRDLRQRERPLLPVDLENRLFVPLQSASLHRRYDENQLTRSVITVLTTPLPVTGSPQTATILLVPSLAVCSVATTIFVPSGLLTKSIAPPIPLNTLPGII